MTCETLRELLLEFVDGTLDEAAAGEARAHVATCGACAREVARHRAAWQLLGELPSEATSATRLRQMAATALATVRGETSAESPAARVAGRVIPLPGAPRAATPPTLSLRRRIVRVASAAAVVLAIAFATDFALRSRTPSSPEEAPPGCLADPEFVGDFEVLRDLPELADSSDGQLLDLDHDDVLMLQLFEDV